MKTFEQDITVPQIGQDEEKGASMLEYALLAALIAVVCILAITFLGRQACVTFSRVGSSVQGANNFGG